MIFFSFCWCGLNLLAPLILRRSLSLTTIDVLSITLIVHVLIQNLKVKMIRHLTDESTCVLYETPLSISFFNQSSQTVVLHRFQFKMSIEVVFFLTINLVLFFIKFFLKTWLMKFCMFFYKIFSRLPYVYITKHLMLHFWFLFHNNVIIWRIIVFKSLPELVDCFPFSENERPKTSAGLTSIDVLYACQLTSIVAPSTGGPWNVLIERDLLQSDQFSTTAFSRP